jgi:hypothetical protein
MMGRRWIRGAALAAAALAGAAGCGGGGAGAPDASATLEVTLGGAAQDGSGFEPLAGDVSLIPGAQGGFHVWMKYRVAGGSPETAHLAYTVRRVSDGHLILTAQRQQDIGAPGADGYWESPSAITAFMCPSPIGVQVHDEAMHFRLEISGSDGTLQGIGEADVTPHCPDGDQGPYCLSICSG